MLKVKGIACVGGVGEWVYFLLKKTKTKKLNCSLLNYSHVSREVKFWKIFRISSISQIRDLENLFFLFHLFFIGPQMEECRDHKRTRVDDGVNSPESKRFHADSAESELNSPEAKRIHDDLLNILDDSDVVTDRDSAIQGLDSVIRSFEEEILVPSPAMAAQELTSDSGESQPELGYLLGASDDELGLPPTAASASGEEARIEAVDFETRSSDSVGLDGMLGFENEMRSYDSFEFGIGVDPDSHVNDGGSEFVPLGGLFDHSDVSEFSWRPESLPAL